MKAVRSFRLSVTISVIALIVVTTFLTACAPPGSTPAPGPTAAPASTPAPAPAKVFKLKHHGYHAPGNNLYEAQVRLADNLRKWSGGRVDITVYPENAIVPSAELHTAAQKGVVDMTYTSHTYTAGIVPGAIVAAGLPVSWRGVMDVYDAFELRGMLKEMREAYAEHNLYYLYPGCSGENQLWSRKPVVTEADMQGLKVRAYGDFNKLFGDLGAKIVNLAHAESYTALSTGTIDAYFTTGSIGLAYKHYEIAKYMMEPALTTSTSCILVNMNVWNSLPDDLKAMFQEAAKLSMFETYGKDRSLYDKEISSAFTIVRMSDALMAKMNAMAPALWKAAAKDARSERMVKIVDELCRSRGYMKK